MELKEWIKKYECEAEPLKVLNGYKLHFEPDKGFFYWKMIDKTFIIDHTCTNDIRYFDRLTSQMAKDNGCTLKTTMTTRSARAYVRVTKSHLNLKKSGIRPNGKWYWFFEKEVI